MRKFLISVNGKSYDVEVEEVKGGMSAPISAPVAAPAPAAAAPAPAAAAPAPAPAPAAAPANGTPDVYKRQVRPIWASCWVKSCFVYKAQAPLS